MRTGSASSRLRKTDVDSAHRKPWRSLTRFVDGPFEDSRRNDFGKTALSSVRTTAQGSRVQVYEIRVTPERPSGPAIYASAHINDHAAVRRAMCLAKPGQSVEVWCEARCVYSGTPPQFAIH
jgi:hypothetical protein